MIQQEHMPRYTPSTELINRPTFALAKLGRPSTLAKSLQGPSHFATLLWILCFRLWALFVNFSAQLLLATTHHSPFSLQVSRRLLNLSSTSLELTL